MRIGFRALTLTSQVHFPASDELTTGVVTGGEEVLASIG